VRLILAFLLAGGLLPGLGLAPRAEAAQAAAGTIRIEVVEAGKPVAAAQVSAAGRSAATDASGIAILTLPPGPVSIVASKDGYGPATASVDVVAGVERSVRLVLAPGPPVADQSPILASTRTGSRADEQAVAVDVLSRDAIEQQLLITPGNVGRLLDVVPGLRIQTTSPELGMAMVRTQGLPGQYTRLLSDGVPLYFDLPGGLAPLQIPPLDLDRIEVIKGGASALFGANALAGTVNLLSRRPGAEAMREFLFSQSARGATDGVLFLSSPSSGSWSHTLLAGAHRQTEKDVDGDGWSDLAGYSRGHVRPRLFWNNGRGKSVSGTAGVTFEKREGGSEIAHQSLETKIADGALFGQMPLGRYVLAGAGSLYVQSRVHDFAAVREHERRESATIELEVRGSAPRQTWVTGIAADWFTIRTPEPLVSAYVAPRGGIFAHDDVRVAPWLTVSGSGRIDYVKGAGEVLRVNDFFFSPRGSALVHGGPWAARVSAGRSYFVPTPLTAETEAAGFERLTIEGPLEIETARSVSADLSYRNRGSAVTLTVFETHIDDPARVDRTTYTLRTDPDPIVTKGVEVSGSVRRAPFVITGSYTFVRARGGDDLSVPLTPRHRAVVHAEATRGRNRFGVNVSFTGTQRLEANPYRSESEPYTVIGLAGERRFGRYRLFVNADNLADVRQADWDPIMRPSRDVDGRWTVDAWAPLEGRVINAGIRIGF
jgi:iron complex outermembrane receptor protein